MRRKRKKKNKKRKGGEKEIETMKIKQREAGKKCKRRVIGKKKWVLPGIEPSEGITAILKRPGEDTGYK